MIKWLFLGQISDFKSKTCLPFLQKSSLFKLMIQKLLSCGVSSWSLSLRERADMTSANMEEEEEGLMSYNAAGHQEAIISGLDSFWRTVRLHHFQPRGEII